MRFLLIVGYVICAIIYLVAVLAIVNIVNTLTPDNLWVRVPCWGILGGIVGWIVAISVDLGNELNRSINRRIK
jgi:uncharacterized membrane protein